MAEQWKQFYLEKFNITHEIRVNLVKINEEKNFKEKKKTVNHQGTQTDRPGMENKSTSTEDLIVTKDQGVQVVHGVLFVPADRAVQAVQLKIENEIKIEAQAENWYAKNSPS